MRASKRLLVSMRPNVHLKVTTFLASVATVRATERPFFGMGPYMCREVASCCTRVVALFASKRLLSTVTVMCFFR